MPLQHQPYQYPVNSTLLSFPYDLLRKNLSSGNLIKFPRVNVDTIRYPSWHQFGAYSNMITHTRHYIVYATSNSTLHQKYTINKRQNDCESEKYLKPIHGKVNYKHGNDVRSDLIHSYSYVTLFLNP